MQINTNILVPKLNMARPVRFLQPLTVKPAAIPLLLVLVLGLNLHVKIEAIDRQYSAVELVVVMEPIKFESSS